nr:VRR-NUC domain-containing protein [bacterium]
MTEAQIEARMVRMVKARGGLCYKFVSPGTAGVPDRIIITPTGRVVFVELKTQTGQLANIQRFQIGEIKRRGADARVVKGWDAAKALVDEVMPV